MAEKNNANQKSLEQTLRTLDKYDKFKLTAVMLKRKLNDCLKEAIVDFVNKYTPES